MKRIIFIVVCLLISFSTFAQSEIAVVSHEGNLSAFFGEKALFDAQKAAVDGDVISLSNGKFKTFRLYRAVTIRGVGINDHATMVYWDGEHSEEQMYIGNLLEDELDGKSVSLEGICFDNCDFPIVNPADSVSFNKCSFINCGSTFSSGSTCVRHLFLRNCDVWNKECFNLSVTKELNISNSVYPGLGAMGLFTFGDEDTLKVNVSNSVITTGSLWNSKVSNSFVHLDDSFGSFAFIGDTLNHCIITGVYSDNLTLANNLNIVYLRIPFSADYFDLNEPWTRENYIERNKRIEGVNVGIFSGEEPYSSQIKMQHIVSYNLTPKSCEVPDDTTKLSVKLDLDIQIEDINDPTFHKFDGEKTRLACIVDGFFDWYHTDQYICEATTTDGINYHFNIDATGLAGENHTICFALTDGSYTTISQIATFTTSDLSDISNVQIKPNEQGKVLYDLQGRKIDNLRNGQIYIRENKKILK